MHMYVGTCPHRKHCGVSAPSPVHLRTRYDLDSFVLYSLYSCSLQQVLHTISHACFHACMTQFIITYSAPSSHLVIVTLSQLTVYDTNYILYICLNSMCECSCDLCMHVYSMYVGEQTRTWLVSHFVSG